jgi:hypothetical protein
LDYRLKLSGVSRLWVFIQTGASSSQASAWYDVSRNRLVINYPYRQYSPYF